MEIEQGSTARHHQQFRMADGRRLGFAEYGPPDGTPVFYFHGWPSSRLEARLAEAVCADLKLRLIAPDRPGYGLSDPKPGRRITDWAADVAALADHLRIAGFSLLGVSGGGPYAVACAAQMRGRAQRAGLVCSVAPLDAPAATKGMVPLHRWLLAFGRRAPWLAEKLGLGLLRFFWGKGHQVIPERVLLRLPQPDQHALASEPLRLGLIAASTEALRQGVGGAVIDGLLYTRPWGFSLAEVAVPVLLWQGELDNIVPPAMGHYLAERIPGCKARFCPADGHFSLAFTRTREIFSSLLD